MYFDTFFKKGAERDCETISEKKSESELCVLRQKLNIPELKRDSSFAARQKYPQCPLQFAPKPASPAASSFTIA